MNKRFYILMLAVFVALTALIYVLGQSDAFSYKVMSIGNGVLFFLSVLSYAISSRYANSDNNGQFVRGVMGGTFLKFFLALIAGLVYVVLNKDNINIADILGLMVMYIMYTTIETLFLAKSSRSGKK